MLKTLRVTDEMRDRIDAVRAALVIYQPGLESAARVEIPKLALADAFLTALTVQETRHDVNAARLAALPRPAPLAIVEVSLRPKRRRRA